ncbi:MAG: SGNH/GDSL hydrolase family protein [Dehalococcoidia bacterium]|nr:SGNH/GDSL hydrolase family protein [Dehalococcoidia bacterium]
MKRLLLFVFVPAVVVGLVAAFAPTSDTSYSCGPLPPQLQHEYLALGDSLGYGYGATDPATKGYVPLFRDYLVSKDWLHRPLLLKNLSVPGATSTTLIYGQLQPPQPPQLPAALAELRARNGNWWPFDDINVVTVDIGGNDLLATLQICTTQPLPVCFVAQQAAFDTIAANLDYTLDELRAAAGPFTKIIVMTYYNGFVAQGRPDCNALAPLGELALEGNLALGRPKGANDYIRDVADANGAKVAELVPGGDWPALLGPTNILSDCVHANDSGYAIMADAFADAYEAH